MEELKLKDYQRECADKGLDILKENNLVYIALMMRLGKSLISLTIANEFNAKSVLFLTKKNAIKSVQNDYVLSKYSFELNVTNYEQSEKLNGDDYDLIILDESNEKISAFPKMGRYAKAVKKLCRNKPLIFLSGTPTPESLSQLYHQLNMSDWSPFKRYTNFYRWSKDYVDVYQIPRNGFPVNQYERAKEELVLKETDHLFVRLTQKEAGFSDEIKDVVHKVRMSNRTREMISRIRTDKIIEGNKATYIADTASKEMQGIHQLGSGTLKVDDTLSVTIDTSKVDYIKSNFEGLKYAIFYNYKQELEMLKDSFPNWTDNDEDFNNSDDLVYLGQIVSKRSGVSLKTADCLIFLSTPFSATSYFQGRSRHAHSERTGGCEVHFLIGNVGLDSYIYKSVKDKKRFTTAHYRRVKIPIESN